MKAISSLGVRSPCLLPKLFVLRFTENFIIVASLDNDYSFKTNPVFDLELKYVSLYSYIIALLALSKYLLLRLNIVSPFLNTKNLI